MPTIEGGTADASAQKSPWATVLSVLGENDADSIVYASPHINDFLGSTDKFRTGMPCRDFLKGLALDPEEVAGANSLLELTQEKAAKKLHHMSLYLKAEYTALVEGTAPANVGVALLPTAAAGGRKITCRLLMTLVEHPIHGLCCLTLLCDATQQMSVEQVLTVASTGDYFKALRGEKVRARSPEFMPYLERVWKETLDTIQVDSATPSPHCPSHTRRLIFNRAREEEKTEEVRTEGSGSGDCQRQ